MLWLILMLVALLLLLKSTDSESSAMALSSSSLESNIDQDQGIYGTADRGLGLKGINSTCFLYTECSECTDVSIVGDDQTVSCIWCSDKSLCVSASAADSYCAPSDQMRSCDANYYTIIFIVVLAALFCLCCCTCYMKRYRMRGDDGNFLAPLLPSAARQLLWRRSFTEDGVKDWMCIICGFDNKNANVSCR